MEIHKNTARHAQIESERILSTMQQHAGINDDVAKEIDIAEQRFREEILNYEEREKHLQNLLTNKTIALDEVESRLTESLAKL